MCRPAPSARRSAWLVRALLHKAPFDYIRSQLGTSGLFVCLALHMCQRGLSMHPLVGMSLYDVHIPSICLRKGAAMRNLTRRHNIELHKRRAHTNPAP